MSTTLATIRSESGKTLGEIHACLKSKFPEVAPKERSGIIHWEKQGIMDVRVIRALSTVYGKKFDVIESAALLSRADFLSRKKVTKQVTLS